MSFKDKVSFDQAKIKGDLFMQPGGKDNPCVIEGEASFSGASIGGQANFLETIFEKNTFFYDAHIGGMANFQGVCFKGKVGFDRAKIEGSLFMQPGGEKNPCVIEGEARFHGASIGGQANFLGVSFGRHVYFQGTKVAAEVNILGTTVPVLVADGSHFSKAMNIDAKSDINNLVLIDARIGTLNINWESISGNVQLLACEYNSVENKEKLLSVLLENNVRERQPYEFLENHCREIGEVDFANDVHYKHRRKVAPPLGKILEPPYWKNITCLLWDRFIRYSTGYGVYLYRLPLCVLASFALAFGLFMCPLFVEAVGGSVERTPPWTVAMWLSIKALMPFGTSVEYTGNEVWRWQPTLLGAVTINILKILVWIGISVSLMAAGGLFRAHRK